MKASGEDDERNADQEPADDEQAADHEAAASAGTDMAVARSGQLYPIRRVQLALGHSRPAR
ncbi:hypothetical protein [Streptomyces sp. YGL11-2]|uniref:hypothetical protein n=1 Tax=Streptomyces sp. YGL11-2 TaxID=3414028 RepID=UPI003CE9743F